MRSRSALWRLFVFLAFCNLGCSVNILSNFADKNSNEARLIEANEKIDNGDFEGALEELERITGAFSETADVRVAKASAYAGVCAGFNFFNFAKALKDIGSARLFPFLLSTFRTGTAAKIDACVSAEAQLMAIGSAGARTDDQNVFLTLVELTKIGTILSHYADSDNNGTANAGYNPCTTGPTTRAANGPIADADAQRLGTALTIAMESLGALETSVDLGTDAMEDIDGVCRALQVAAPTYYFCDTTTETFTANQIKGIRSLFNESTVVGLGTNCTGNVVACQCP